MGFGFNIAIIFVIFPLTVILLIIWLFTKNKNFGKTIGCIWIPILCLVTFVSIVHFFASKTELEREDIYGEYVIDRTKYPGAQADWQYNHFRFEITKQNKFLFHITERNRTIKTYIGRVEFLDTYKNPRIILRFNKQSHHIVSQNPTLYRTVWSFYYVFYSTKFNNVFFVKSKWKPIDE